MRLSTLLLPFLAVLPGLAQDFYAPSSASTQLYFAHLTDGGPANGQKWATGLIFVNPNTAAATVNIAFFGDDGKPLNLDFGEGPVTTLTLEIPGGGTRTITSTGASAITVGGWAKAESDLPVSGTLMYRAWQNGAPLWDIAATGTGPSFYYSAFANYNLGIALVNPNSKTIHLKVAAKDKDGTSAGQTIFTLKANEHHAFNLGPAISGMASGFTGSVAITCSDTVPAGFVAWAVNARDNLLSPLPQGEMQLPAPPARRALDTAILMRAAGLKGLEAFDINWGGGVTTESIIDFIEKLTIVVDPTSTVTIGYQAGDHAMHVSQGFLEAMGENRSAIGFALVHMAVLGYEQTANKYMTNPKNKADLIAAMSLLRTGLDYGGAADLFARLGYVTSQGLTVDQRLLEEFDLTSYSTAGQRIQALTQGLREVCTTNATARQMCTAGHNLWHPSYPSTIP